MRKMLILLILLTAACAGPRQYSFDDQDIAKQKFENEDDLFRAVELAEKQETVVNYGKKYLGTRYVYGGQTPRRGFDCSGFTKYVYEKSTGIELPRTAQQMSQIGTSAPSGALRPGDLLFFDLESSLDHVGIYIGKGKFFHASRQHKKLVVADLHNEYFSTRFNTAKRILDFE